MLKNIIKKYLYEPFSKKLYDKFRYLDKEKINYSKKDILNKIQSYGINVQINGSEFDILGPEKIILGNNISIGNNIYINGLGGVIIGDNCNISDNCVISTVVYDYTYKNLPYGQKKDYKPVLIGQNVWIARNAIISPGVTIGDGAIIEVGTIVTNDVAPFEIVGSPKNIHLKLREEKHYIDQEKKDFSLATYKDNADNDIVFILGTGRSGSTSIVDILNQHPECKAFHENIHQLIRISTELAYNPSNKKLLKELDVLFQTKIWNAGKGQLLIHSDQRLWNLVPYLVQYFPNAKFIHLVREPISCIKSMVSRNWYKQDEYPFVEKHDWANFRLQADKLGIYSSDVWNSFSITQRCTWYWKYINRSIEEQLLKLPKNKVLTLNLEELDSSYDTLIAFLGIKKFRFTTKISNVRQKLHNKNYDHMGKINMEKIINKELEK